MENTETRQLVESFRDKEKIYGEVITAIRDKLDELTNALWSIVKTPKAYFFQIRTAKSPIVGIEILKCNTYPDKPGNIELSVYGAGGSFFFETLEEAAGRAMEILHAFREEKQ